MSLYTDETAGICERWGAHAFEAVARVYRVLQYHSTRLSVDEIMSRAGVTRREAREACDMLFVQGLVVRYGAFPELRYRALAIAERLLTARGRAYRAELLAALRRLFPDQEWANTAVAQQPR